MLGATGLARQANRERGPLVNLAGGGDASPQGLNEMLDNAQTKPRAPQFPAAGLVHAIKPFKNTRQVFFGNASTGVRHFEQILVALNKPANRDQAARRSVLNGIVHEVV